MKKIIAILPGDGIGPEVVREARKVLDKVAFKFGHQFEFKEGLIGAVAIDNEGSPLPKKTLSLCLTSDAVLFGAIGDPRYDDPKLKIRPEQGLLSLRKSLGLFANIRPIFTFPDIFLSSPLKSEITRAVDFIVVRELTGGLYFGKHGRSRNGKTAFDTCVYSQNEILRVSELAFDLAQKRRKKVTLVDKANVLETSRLWRQVVGELAQDFPDISLEFMYIDNASMQILKRPRDFDVILTENMFGDILTDEASVITGSLGLLPSASIGEKASLYEPIHGSFPSAAGKNTANPIGAILSSAMMLEYSFGLRQESQAIFKAVEKVLRSGFGTYDIVKDNPLTTSELGKKIVGAIF